MKRKSESVSLSPQQQALVEEHLWQVDLIAKKVRNSLPHYADYEDLVQAGSLGLITAALRYDGRRDVQFRSYASHRIHGAILDSLRALDRAPRKLRRRQKKLERATDEVGARVQRMPTEAEVAEELGVRLADLQKLLQQLQGLGLLSTETVLAPANGDDGIRSEPAAGLEWQPDRMAEKAELRSVLKCALGKLPARERAVVELHDGREMRMDEIGAAFGVGGSRISQIRRRALERLRWELRCLGIGSTAAAC